MVEMLLDDERLDQHVIYVDFHGFAQHVDEYLVDKSLVSCTGILYSKSHDLVTEYAPLSDEGGILLIIWVH